MKGELLCLKTFLREGGETMKNFKVLLTACLVLLLAASTAFGAVSSASDVELMSENYSMASATISISGNSVKVESQIIGRAGKTTKTSINLYLQQYKNGSWVNVDNWTSLGDTVARSLSKTKKVTKGYKYRAKAVCTVYVGSDKETVTKYSSTISC